MKKGIFILFILLFSFGAAFSQVYQKNSSYGFEYKGLKVDRAFGLPVIDTLAPPDVPDDISKSGHLACYIHAGDTSIVFYNGNAWIKLAPEQQTTQEKWLTLTSDSLIVNVPDLIGAKILYISMGNVEMCTTPCDTPGYYFDSVSGQFDFSPMGSVFIGYQFHILYNK